jgi:hypothetical protein
MKPVEDVVEDFEQRNLALKAASGGAEMRANVAVKGCFGYLGWYGAHRSRPSW